MKQTLSFTSPFWQWGGLGFGNCYAAVYMYLQDIADESIVCRAKEGKGCNDCGNCSDTLNNLFATIAGQWTTRQSWSGENTAAQNINDEEYGSASSPTEKLVDFIIGFTGYEYEKVSENFKKNIIASIDANTPIIAKLKNDKLLCDLGKGYRVIIGYDEDKLFEPNYTPAADLKDTITYDEIEYLYIFGKKIPQRYTFLDFLKMIEKSMNSDFTEGIWHDFIHKFDVEGEKLWDINSAEIKNRFIRLRNVMDWLPNIGHGFQTAFRDKKLLAALGADVNRLGELFDTIGHQTHLLHNRGYMLSAISDSALALNATTGDDSPFEKLSLAESSQQILDSVMDCDLKILLAIKKAIRKMSVNSQ